MKRHALPVISQLSRLFMILVLLLSLPGINLISAALAGTYIR